MIHDWDKHYWLAKTPEGWISALDHSSNEPIFKQATRIRIEPLSTDGVMAVLDADVPGGYTAFLRTNRAIKMSGEIMRLSYLIAVERGQWTGAEDIGGFEFTEEGDKWGGLPVKDGFRAELCCWDGAIHFEASPNFTFSRRDDFYKFHEV